ncbi:M48 family metalloprotease [Streptomyces sp. GQFP]|uniref:M48 family metalloprotease n=1 Tax=Streptomyces sp. GQFP TaxID=2907545 RepID=UPI0022855142|nr:M48 family metalloprotease [Streptomyces sp. GQFP]
MTQPPSSPPEYPEPAEQPLSPPTYPETAAHQLPVPPSYPETAHQSPTPPSYPETTHQPPTPPSYPEPTAQTPLPPQYPETAPRPPGPRAHPEPAPRPPSPPTYPGQAAAQPSAPPAYPGSAAAHSSAPPPYPGQSAPAYPQAAQAPQQPPQYPDLAQPPSYPDPAQPPQYADAAQPPSYPAAAPQAPAPAYPESAQPPTYPGSPLNPAQPPPAYPGAAPAQPPPSYPQAATAQPPVPPQYAPPQQPPTAPAPPTPAPPAEHHPHHIPTDRQRVHISAHQRRTDATAVGNLLLYLPNFLCSLLVVSLFSLFFQELAFLVVILWLLSGALVFHRPTESALARRLLHLRYPTPQERAKLEPVWREVTARAGVEGRNYELWVEDSDGLNAVAAAGHIVGVTRFAMNQLPNGELAAVMAHELGHHVGGHAWSGLLGYWYAQPGRIAWRVLRALSVIVFKVSRAFSCFGVAFVVLVLGSIALATISTLYGLPLLILGVPYALAAVGRRAELRADEHAAALGFAPMLAAVLHKLHQDEQAQTAALAALNGGVAPEESPLSKLLSSHPDYHTRLHHLQPYLQQQR